MVPKMVADLSLGALRAGRVQKDSSILESSVHVCHHGPDIASSQWSPSILYTV